MSPTVPPISTMRDVGVARAPRRDEWLDLVGDVRDHLHRAAEVVAAALLVDHALVDLAGGEVVALAHLGADEALVVAEVEVGLGAVVGDEHFAVLERAHRARIDVDVRIELDHRDLEAARFEDRGEGGGGDALAQGGNHTAGDEDILGHFMYYRPFYYSSAIALTSSMKIACPVCISRASSHSSLRARGTARFRPPCPD